MEVHHGFFNTFMQLFIEYMGPDNLNPDWNRPFKGSARLLVFLS